MEQRKMGAKMINLIAFFEARRWVWKFLKPDICKLPRSQPLPGFN
jgi:hypothetical protein